MDTFIVAALCLLGVSNAGVIDTTGTIGDRTLAGSTLVAGPSGIISTNDGLLGTDLASPLGVRSLATGLAPALGGTVISGPSGTIVNNKNIALTAELGLVRSGIATPGLIDNVGLVGGVVAPSVVSAPIAAPIVAPGVIATRTIAGGLVAPGVAAAPGVLAARTLATEAIIDNGLGLTSAGLLANNGLLANGFLANGLTAPGVGRAGLVW